MTSIVSAIRPASPDRQSTVVGVRPVQTVHGAMESTVATGLFAYCGRGGGHVTRRTGWTGQIPAFGIKSDPKNGAESPDAPAYGSTCACPHSRARFARMCAPARGVTAIAELGDKGLESSKPRSAALGSPRCSRCVAAIGIAARVRRQRRSTSRAAGEVSATMMESSACLDGAPIDLTVEYLQGSPSVTLLALPNRIELAGLCGKLHAKAPREDRASSGWSCRPHDCPLSGRPGEFMVRRRCTSGGAHRG